MANLKKDLIYLVFSQDACYREITRKKPSEVELNLSKGTWSWRGCVQKIGESRPVELDVGNYNSIVGIYNIKKISHLQNMVSEAESISERQGRSGIHK